MAASGSTAIPSTESSGASESTEALILKLVAGFQERNTDASLIELLGLRLRQPTMQEELAKAEVAKKLTVLRHNLAFRAAFEIMQDKLRSLAISLAAFLRRKEAKDEAQANGKGHVEVCLNDLRPGIFMVNEAAKKLAFQPISLPLRSEGLHVEPWLTIEKNSPADSPIPAPKFGLMKKKNEEGNDGWAVFESPSLYLMQSKGQYTGKHLDMSGSDKTTSVAELGKILDNMVLHYNEFTLWAFEFMTTHRIPKLGRVALEFPQAGFVICRDNLQQVLGPVFAGIIGRISDDDYHSIVTAKKKKK